MTTFGPGERVRVNRPGSIYHGREGTVAMSPSKVGGVVVVLNELGDALHTHERYLEAVMTRPVQGQSHVAPVACPHCGGSVTVVAVAPR